MAEWHLGIDVGSISVNTVVVDGSRQVVEEHYTWCHGRPYHRLEAVLRGHADVAEAAVVGVPSERWGETPVAFVVPRPGAAASAQALLEWTNSRVGKIQRLAAVELVESLPRSAIGKVLKRELREAYRRKAGALT